MRYGSKVALWQGLTYLSFSRDQNSWNFAFWLRSAILAWHAISGLPAQICVRSCSLSVGNQFALGNIRCAPRGNLCLGGGAITTVFSTTASSCNKQRFSWCCPAHVPTKHLRETISNQRPIWKRERIGEGLPNQMCSKSRPCQHLVKPPLLFFAISRF